jgi:hypothetical protein
VKPTVVTILALAIIGAGPTFAGEPVYPKYGELTFADNADDMVKSDGIGAYTAAIARTMNLIMVLAKNKEGRMVYYDFSNCVSDTCDCPFLKGYNTIGRIWISGPKDMLPGESKNCTVQFWLPPLDKKADSWHVNFWSRSTNPPIMTAFDTDGDEKTDRWQVVSSADTVGELVTGDDYHVAGEYLMPFTLTFDLD